jgi:hypothetical protein
MEIKVPTSWDEVKIWQLMELLSMDKAQGNLRVAIETISILCDTDTDTVKKMPHSAFNDVLNQLSFASTMPECGKKDEVTINGNTYRMTEPVKFTVGQWADVEEYLKDYANNLDRILAVIYSGDKYEGTTQQRVEDMREASVTDVYGAAIFFSLFGAILYTSTKGFSVDQAKEMLMEKAKTYTVSGDGTDLYTDLLTEISQSLNQSQE